MNKEPSSDLTLYICILKQKFIFIGLPTSQKITWKQPLILLEPQFFFFLEIEKQ